MNIHTGYHINELNEEQLIHLDQTTIFKSANSPTGYVVSFRIKARDCSWMGVIGDWMFSDLYHSSHYVSGKYWPHEWRRGYFPHMLLGLKTPPKELHDINNKKIDPRTFEFDWEILKLGLYEMNKDSETGIFSCTIPLPSGTFNYRFVLDIPDGNPINMITIPDPNNLPMYGKEQKQKYSQIIVPFDKEKQEEDRSVELPYQSGLKGKVVYSEYKTDPSFGVGEKQPVAIYLPAEYDENKETAYPVLYLSHGGGGTFTDWVTQGSLMNMMDHFIGERQTEPMVVVMMDNEVFEWKHKDSCIPNLIRFLKPFIENNYNVETNSERCAFAGFSAGGFLAFDVWANCAPTFAYIGIWSAGQRSELDFSKEELKHSQIHVGGGRYDDAFYAFGYRLENQLYEYGIDFTSYFPEGGHQWSVWRKLLEDFVTRVLWRS